MSITRQEPGSAGLVRTADADGLLGEAAHYGGDKSPSAAQRLGPLRELIDDRLLDALLERSRDEAGGLRLTGEGSMLGELVKAVLERALEAELTGHLGYARHDPSGHNSGNSRNGTISKKVQTGIGPVGIEVPRDRAGDFEPRLVPKRSGRISGGLDDMIISLYAHGMSVRDILHHLKQVYGTELSHETVSRITDAVLEEVRAWEAAVAELQGRPWRTGSGAREVLVGQPAGSALGSRSVCAGVVVRGSALLCVGVFAGHAACVLVSGGAWASWHARGQRFEPA